jgi:hypothetical protein
MDSDVLAALDFLLAEDIFGCGKGTGRRALAGALGVLKAASGREAMDDSWE